MRYHLLLLSFFISATSFSQTQKITATYNNRMPRLQVKFNADSTFEYTTNEQHPLFYRWEDFYEKENGPWLAIPSFLIPACKKTIC